MVPLQTHSESDEDSHSYKRKRKHKTGLWNSMEIMLMTLGPLEVGLNWLNTMNYKHPKTKQRYVKEGIPDID